MTKAAFLFETHSARVVHSTSFSDATSRGRHIWAHMHVFRASLYVPTSVGRYSYVRLGRNVNTTSSLRPRRIKMSGKLTYGTKLGRPIDVRGRRAEWESNIILNIFLSKRCHIKMMTRKPALLFDGRLQV